MTSSLPPEESLNVQLQVMLDNEALEGFTHLLAELLHVAELPTLRYLREILVVPDTQIALTANRLIREVKPDAAGYIPGNTPARGIAVPLETGSECYCCIVLGESLVRDLTPDHHYPHETVSTVLEELLHARIYTTRWQQEDLLHQKASPRQTIVAPCQRDLYDLCRGSHDEYMVNHWKTALFASLPLYEVEGGFTMAFLQYGNPVAPLLDRAAMSLRALILDGRNGALSIQEAWSRVSQVLYRGIFEPLARDAGYRAGSHPEAPEPSSSAQESAFYQKYLAPFWEPMQQQLERSCQSELSAMEESLQEMVRQVEAFLEHIGITISELEDGNCWVDFLPTRFLVEGN